MSCINGIEHGKKYSLYNMYISGQISLFQKSFDSIFEGSFLLQILRQSWNIYTILFMAF